MFTIRSEIVIGWAVNACLLDYVSRVELLRVAPLPLIRNRVCHGAAIVCFLALSLIASAQSSSTNAAGNGGNPSIANFYPEQLMITLYFSNGKTRSYPAANHTDRPQGDPCTVGSHGPCPAGRWYLNPPDLVKRTTRRYHRVGAAFFLIGRPGSVPFQRSVGLHAGSDSHLNLTWGCIRMSNADLEEVLAYLHKTHLVLEAITIPGKARCKDTTSFVAQTAERSLLDAAISRQAQRASIEYPMIQDEVKSLSDDTLHKMFTVTSYMDGAAGEEHASNLFLLLTKFGDGAYSAALAREPSTVRMQVLKALDFFAATDSSPDKDSIEWARKFPLTYQLGRHE